MSDLVLDSPMTFGGSDPTVSVWLERKAGSGAFSPAPWLRCDRIVERTGDIGEARLSAVLSDSGNVTPEVAVQVPWDRRVAVLADGGSWSRRRWLFDGYVRQVGLDMGGTGDQRRESVSMRAEHVAVQWAQSDYCMVCGQWWPGPAEDDLAVEVTAAPCVFNPEGVPNGSAALHELSETYLFADGSEAVLWTYARALYYVLSWWTKGLSAKPPITWLWVKAALGEMLEYTDVEDAGGAEELSPLGVALLQPVAGIAVEGLNGIEAISLLCASAGLRWSIETGPPEDGADADDDAPCSSLYIWHPDGSEATWLRSEAVGTPVATRTAEEVFEANTFGQLSLAIDYGAICNRPVVVGDIERYEVTVELRPGWPANSDLNPASQEDMEDTLEAFDSLIAEGADPDPDDGEVGSKFLRNGSAFLANRDAGRRWVLNEAGDYASASYKREAGPGPFSDDWPTFVFDEDVIGTNAGDDGFVPRRRRLLPCVSASGASPLPVRVEVSLDRNADEPSWCVPEAKVTLLTDQCGIYFEVDNPAKIAYTDAGGDFLTAILEGRAGVRVTATVEGDARLMVAGALAESPKVRATRVMARLIDRSRTFGYANATETNSALQGVSGVTVGDTDDTDALQAFADAYAAANASRVVAGRVDIPWLSEAVAMGDAIAGIRGGRRIAFADDTTTWRAPQVVSREWLWTAAGAGSTRLALEDLRMSRDQGRAR